MASVSPLSPLPFEAFTITLPDDATVVQPDRGMYNNTKELLVLNLSSTDNVLMRIVDLGDPPLNPSDPALLTLATSTLIPAGASISLCLGTESKRQAVRTSTEWNVEGPGSQLALVFRAESGEDVQVNITYVQSIGGESGP